MAASLVSYVLHWIFPVHYPEHTVLEEALGDSYEAPIEVTANDKSAEVRTMKTSESL